MKLASGTSGLGRAILSAALAVPLGFVAFIPLFVPLFSGPDVAGWPGETFVFGVTSLFAYFSFGGAIGYFNNPRFWLIAGVLAWVAVIDAAYNLAYAATNPTYPERAVPTALLVLVGPLLVALAGSHAGRAFATRRRVVRS